ncbi:MAG: DUF4328 domain-containing protein [Patescibacteria group bacterium]|jgi:hypothetical protein
MNDRKKTIFGWLLITVPVPLIVATLACYAIYAFSAAASINDAEPSTITLSIQILMGALGIIGILGVFIGIPVGIFLLISRAPLDLDASEISSPMTQEYRSAAALAKVTVGSLIAFSLAASIDVFRQGAILGYLRTLNLQSALPEFSSTFRLDIIEPIVLVLFLISAISLLRWKYLAYRNATINTPSIRYSHHWAVAGYFVPIANFVMPYKTMKELATVHRANTASRFLLFWWASFLMAQIVVAIVPNQRVNEVVILELWRISFQLVWNISLILSAAALIFIVLDITSKQEHAFRDYRP